MTTSPTPAWPDRRPLRYASPLGPRPPATQPPANPPLHAPPRGLTYRGDFYQGGESLPLFQEDEQALRRAGAHNRETQALRDFQTAPAPKKEFRLAVPQVGPGNTYYEDEPLEDISGGTPDVLGRQTQTHDLAALPESLEQGLSYLPAEIRPYVLPEEAARLSRNQAARVVEAFNSLPPDLEFMAASRLGEAKRGWYRSTARDLVSLFGAGTPSFVAVLAATSPQKSVADNLRNATRIWAEYQISMRGTGDPISIEAWLRKRRLLSPQVPMKGEVPNVVRALTDPHPRQMGTLSGPKVDSFRANLLGDLSRVTNDVWAAALADIPQGWLGGKDSGEEEHTFALPTGGYIAYSAKTRRVAHRLNQELQAGERPWEPAEVQETAWSAIRALAYLGGLSRRQAQPLDPIQVLNSLTHGTVSNNADFSTLLLSDPVVLSQLQRLGLGRAIGVVRRAARRDREAKPEIPGRPAEHAAALTDRAAVERVARRAGKYISGYMSPTSKYARRASALGLYLYSRRGRPVRYAEGAEGRSGGQSDPIGDFLAALESLPEVPAKDRAAWRRVRVTHFAALGDLRRHQQANNLGGAAASAIWWWEHTAHPVHQAHAQPAYDALLQAALPEAPEVDWRPPESMGEDYHAYSRRGLPVRYAEGAAGQAGGWEEPLIAASGNTEEDLSFDQALARTQSGNQRAFRQVAEGVLAQVGLKGQSQDAVGDWDDGAENSLLSVIRQPTDPETLRYAGAWYGLLGNQKAVLVFHPTPRGKDSVYSVQVPETDLGKVRQQLSAAGISFRTLVPGPRGTRVVIYDQARSLRDRVALFASQHHAPIRESLGQGEYVGGSTRAEARSHYRDIIARYEAGKQAGGQGQGAHADQGGGGPVPPQPGPH